MKMWKILVVLAVVVIVVVALGRDAMVRHTVERSLAAAAGADVSIEQVDANLLNSTLTLKGLHVHNPEGFVEETAIEIDRVFVRYRLMSLFKRIKDLKEVELDVRRVMMVTDEHGNINLQQFEIARNEAEAVAKPSTPQPETAPQPAEVPIKGEAQPPKPPRERGPHIDLLTLRLGEIEMRDYSRGGPEPQIRKYVLNFERTFEDVKDPDDIVQALTMNLAFAIGPQMIREVLQESGVQPDALRETIETHEGDLEELGRKLDAQTKDAQRELRRQFRALREAAREEP